MLISHPRPIIFRGAPAELRVVRNNGSCWGTLNAAGQRFDVVTPDDDDLYDESDEDALDVLEALAADDKHIADCLVSQ
jgi:hypothetical protein